MGAKSKIEWCDSTWNPITGCLHGCEYCYARKIAQRFGGVKIGDFNGQTCALNEPYRRSKDGQINPYPYEFLPTLHRYRMDQPKKWVTPRNIFVCSMADLFGDWVPDSWIREVMDATGKAPQHRYLFLTKNPFRYSNYGVPQDENKWYGTSVTTEKDITRMNMIHTKNRFISIEPLLQDLKPESWGRDYFSGYRWIILGAESGNRKDKTAPKKEWIEKLTRLADKHQIPVFMKDSLIPIVGEVDMRRETPWDLTRTLIVAGKDAGQYADFPTLMPGT